jgi:hypothetical protein
MGFAGVPAGSPASAGGPLLGSVCRQNALAQKIRINANKSMLLSLSAPASAAWKAVSFRLAFY